MPFKNDTDDTMEICVPIVVAASVRFWIEPGEELTAEAVNGAVDQLAFAASDDVIRLPKFDGDFSMNVLGIERGGVADFYNSDKSGETDLPEGIEYAPVDPLREAAPDMLAVLVDLLKPGSVNGGVIESGRDLLARLGHDVRAPKAEER